MNLRQLLVLWSFVFVASSTWAIPPYIKADQYLMSAMKCMVSNDFGRASNLFEKILGLGIKVPDELHFHYGKSLIKRSRFTKGIASIEKYLTIAGKGGKYSKASLEILAEAKAVIEKKAQIKAQNAEPALCNRLIEEDKQRKSIVKGDESVSYSDSHSDKTFNACGKEWRVGKYNVDWSETQSWIGALGGSWRNPTSAELEELSAAVGWTSEIGWDYIWTEKNDDSTSAFDISFLNCNIDMHSLGTRFYYHRAVAVR